MLPLAALNKYPPQVFQRNSSFHPALWVILCHLGLGNDNRNHLVSPEPQRPSSTTLLSMVLILLAMALWSLYIVSTALWALWINFQRVGGVHWCCVPNCTQWIKLPPSESCQEEEAIASCLGWEQYSLGKCLGSYHLIIQGHS